MRTLLITATLATLLIAVPAQAKPVPPEYQWFSTIDCGRGPVSVVSDGRDEWSKMEELGPRRKYTPVEWHLRIGDRTYDAVKPGRRPKRTATCTYADDMATGTVVVEARGYARGADSDSDSDSD